MPIISKSTQAFEISDGEKLCYFKFTSLVTEIGLLFRRAGTAEREFCFTQPLLDTHGQTGQSGSELVVMYESSRSLLTI